MRAIANGDWDHDNLSLGVHRAMHEMPEFDGPDDGSPGDVDVSALLSVLPEESLSLMEHPEVIEAGAQAAEAEAAVLRAEDAGISDEIAMHRLDRARSEERAVLVRLQRARAVAHTVRPGQGGGRRGPASAFGEVAA